MSCQFPGCSKRVYPGSAYCSRSHRDNASGMAQGTSWSRYLPRMGGGSAQVHNNFHRPGAETASMPSQKSRMTWNKTQQSYYPDGTNGRERQRRRVSSFPSDAFPHGEASFDKEIRLSDRPGHIPGAYNSEEIRFYDRDKRYFEFTNFSDHPIRYNMKEYPTSEHLFQSLKFTDTKDSESIRVQPNPRSAFEMADKLRHRARKDWISGNINIKMMEKTLFLKFTQHEDLKEMLLETGNAHLVEDSPIDSYWGIGSDQKGRNELGKALEKVRAILRSESL